MLDWNDLRFFLELQRSGRLLTAARRLNTTHATVARHIEAIEKSLWSAADTLRAMAASLAEDFQGDLVRIVAFEAVDGIDDADWLQVIAEGDARLSGFRDLADSGEPVCGRLHPDKNALLYGVRAEEVQSSALLVLPGTGLVAVGSRDPNRFFPGMGTLFLRMMGEALTAALQRFR